MIQRRFGLHGKFVISLLVAAALPFFVGLIFFEILGYRYLIEQRGHQHQTDASALISAISQAANAEADKLRTWLASESGLRDHLAILAQDETRPSQDQARMLDEIWASLPGDDPQLGAVILNPAADSLRRYQQVHPAAVEILATDAGGHLLAATDKPSDFRQADEQWWQLGTQLDPGQFWRDTIIYDDSAGSFTIDVVLPYYRDGRLQGVFKMGLEVARLIPHLIMRGIQTDANWHFVLRSGHILLSSHSEISIPRQRVSYDLLNEMRRQEHGWTLLKEDGEEQQILGFSAFQADCSEPNAYVVFSSGTTELFEPVWGNFIGLGIAGLSLLGLCLLAGFFLIQRKVLRPLVRIERAIQSMSVLARLRHKGDDSEQLRQQQEVEAQLRDIQKIRSGDQMELLAREIATMISRVLHYQSELDKSERGGRPQVTAGKQDDRHTRA